MQTEIEATFTDIQRDEIRAMLKNLGATLVRSDRLMKRKVFDFPNQGLDHNGAWVRVRDEGDKITMSYKRLVDRTLTGVQEVNLVLDNYEQGCEFVKALGLVEKSYQETRRESWELNGVQIEIDEWPWIPPFVEIEGPSEAAVQAVAEKLQFDWSAALHGSVENVYLQHFDVTEAEVDRWPEITFIPVPDWLEKKRKTRS